MSGYAEVRAGRSTERRTRGSDERATIRGESKENRTLVQSATTLWNDATVNHLVLELDTDRTCRGSPLISDALAGTPNNACGVRGTHARGHDGASYSDSHSS